MQKLNASIKLHSLLCSFFTTSACQFQLPVSSCFTWHKTCEWCCSSDRQHLNVREALSLSSAISSYAVVNRKQLLAKILCWLVEGHICFRGMYCSTFTVEVKRGMKSDCMVSRPRTLLFGIHLSENRKSHLLFEKQLFEKGR